MGPLVIRSIGWAAVSLLLTGCLMLVACGPKGGGSKPAATPAHSQSMGSPCELPGAIVNQRFKPVDMNNEASVMATAGRPIFICTSIRRAASGRVLNETTQAPVAGASVTIESWHARPPIGGLTPHRQLLKVAAVRTDGQGKWHVREESIWMEGILAADGLPFVLTSYCARANGYAPFVFDPWKHPEGTSGEVSSSINLRLGTDGTAKTNEPLSGVDFPWARRCRGWRLR